MNDDRLEPQIIKDLLGEWRRLLRGSPTQARSVIQRIVEGRIMFIPQKEGKGYDFRAKTRFDRLFSGVAMPKPSWVKDGDKRGTEHIGPEDTFDGDYGRALKKAQDRVKRMASPMGLDTFSIRGLVWRHKSVA